MDKKKNIDFVNKTIKDFECYDCCSMIPKGSKCFTQRINYFEDYFPKQVRICHECGRIRIEKWGTIVKDDKKIKSD